MHDARCQGSTSASMASVFAGRGIALHVARTNKALERKQIVSGYHAEVDSAKIGRGFEATIAISIHPPARTAIEAFAP